MLGVLINVIGIAIGGTAGTLLRSSISKRLVDCLMGAMGLVVIAIGIQSIMGSSNTTCLVISMALGAAIGYALHLDTFIDGLGDKVQKLFKGKKFAEGRFAEAFIGASVLFGVGAMSIMGSLEAGLNGDYSVLLTKSVLDLVSAAALSAAMGVGVLLALVPVCVWEGLIVLLAAVLSPVLGETVIAEMSGVGGAMFIGMGVNMLGLTEKKINVSILLPALIIPPLYIPLVSWLGGLF